jgi:hypothetical protein
MLCEWENKSPDRLLDEYKSMADKKIWQIKTVCKLENRLSAKQTGFVNEICRVQTRGRA